MTMFKDRYCVKVVGSDGLMYTENVHHPLEVLPVKFLLEKKALKPIKSFGCIDTVTGKSITKSELYAE